jgi:hypothetical protein
MTFQAALCRHPGAVLAAARLDRITRRAHTLSQLLEGLGALFKTLRRHDLRSWRNVP